MEKKLKALIDKAQRQHGLNITPCHGKTWEECLVYTDGPEDPWLWFNTPDGSTHTIW
jgi:hypothetical protein